MNSFQLHELETAVALVLLSPRLRVSQTAGRSGHRTRQESRERRDDNNTGDHCLRRRPLRLRSRQRFVRIGREADAGQSFAGFVIQCCACLSLTVSVSLRSRTTGRAPRNSGLASRRRKRNITHERVVSGVGWLLIERTCNHVLNAVPIHYAHTSIHLSSAGKFSERRSDLFVTCTGTCRPRRRDATRERWPRRSAGLRLRGHATLPFVRIGMRRSSKNACSTPPG